MSKRERERDVIASKGIETFVKRVSTDGAILSLVFLESTYEIFAKIKNSYSNVRI